MSVKEKIIVEKKEIIEPKKMGLLVENPVYKPFRYPWCYDAWLTQQRIHWLPEEVPLGDDFRRNDEPLYAKTTEMSYTLEGKNVVLIGDVLFTGRSIRAALSAIDSYGRPKSIELLVLVDRRFSRHLPIQPDYLGAQIDALQGDKVKVVWSDLPKKSVVYLEKNKT